MAKKRIPIPTHLAGSAFRTGELEYHRLSPARLRSDDLGHPFHGARSVGVDLASVVGQCLAYSAIMLPGQRFTHSTAAALMGFPLPPDVALTELHVGVIAPRTPPRRRGVVGHKLAHETGVELVLGNPVSPAIEVWCQLASMLPRDELVVCGDFLVTPVRGRGRRRPAMCTPAELRDAARRWAGTRHAGAIAWAIERVRVGAESRPETLLRLLLVGAGLPEPLVNRPVQVADGLELRPDLLYPAERVAIEYEGSRHRQAGRWNHDIERVELLEQAGWRVIRVTAEHLFGDPHALLTRIRGALAASRR